MKARSPRTGAIRRVPVDTCPPRLAEVAAAPAVGLAAGVEDAGMGGAGYHPGRLEPEADLYRHTAARPGTVWAIARSRGLDSELTVAVGAPAPRTTLALRETAQAHRFLHFRRR